MIRAVSVVLATMLLPALARASFVPRIVFVAADASGTHLFLTSPDAPAVAQLTRGPGLHQSPRFSPDGKRIVFTSNRDGRWRVYTMNSDGSAQRPLTPRTEESVFPAWSPEGGQIAYVARRGPSEQIFLMKADGSGRRALTERSRRNSVPVWSPDGTWIAFVSAGDREEPALFIIRPDGSQRKKLGGPVMFRPGMLHPMWSPDGGEIAMVERVGQAEQQISILDPATGAKRRLTTGYAPHWSRSGRIVFIVPRVGDAQIYVINSDGTGGKRLTTSGTHMIPIWSTAGDWLAYLAPGEGGLGLYAVRSSAVEYPDGLRGARKLANVAGDLSMLPVFSWEPH